MQSTRPSYVSVKEAARRLGCYQFVVVRLYEEGKLSGTYSKRAGWKITEESLTRYIEQAKAPDD